MTNEEAMKLALEALEKADAVIYSEYCGTDCEELHICEPAIKALEEALAKQEQGEPVAHIGKTQFERLKDCGLVTTSLTSHKAFEDDIALYTTPQQPSTIVRKLLTDEQLKNDYQNNEWLDGVRFAEQFHGIKE